MINLKIISALIFLFINANTGNHINEFDDAKSDTENPATTDCLSCSGPSSITLYNAQYGYPAISVVPNTEYILKIETTPGNHQACITTPYSGFQFLNGVCRDFIYLGVTTPYTEFRIKTHPSSWSITGVVFTRCFQNGEYVPSGSSMSFSY